MNGKRWDLTTDEDSLSLLTRCRRVPLVHELLWLTVGWSRLANRAVRLEKSSSSIERKFLWSRWQQTRLDLSKRPCSSTNTLLRNITGSVASCYKSHRLWTCLRPLNYVVLFTTITRRFKVRPHFLQTSLQLSSVTSSVSDGPLTQFTAKSSFAMQAIAWGQC